MKEVLKKCFFQFANIQVLDSAAKYAPCLINHHIHNYWELKIFPDGNRNGKLPRLIMVPPDIIHSATPWLFENKSSNFVLGFTQPRISVQISNEGTFSERFCLFSRADDLCPGGLLNVLRKFQVLRAGETEGELLEKHLNNLLNLLFSAVDIALQQAADTGEYSGFSIVERACDRIEREYYNGDLTIEKIAADLNITPGYLANLFQKKELGMVRRYLIQTRLRHAFRLLSTGKYTVKDIAELTGWNSQFYFSNCFKKYYKISPSRVPVNPETTITKIKGR
ncbi:MAG: AraC family transcriptional regulator [Victivallaceae bacterium]|nr:AraC family transcriptional regulator [Victivallaceae bacterium]